MRRPDPDLPLVATRADARDAGMSDSAVGRRLRAGQWSRLRRGSFCREEFVAETRWRAEVLAVVRAHRRRLVLSHAHAARAHGWPAPLGGWGPLSFTSPVGPVRRRAGSRVFVRTLPDDEVVPFGAVLVTAPARTIVDCARHLPPHDALALADAALRRGDVTARGLAAALARAAGTPGVERARRVVTLADGRRESPLESWSAWGLASQGVSPTSWQATLLDAEGVFVGRTDAWWEEGVAGEADGKAKYRLAALERTGLVDAEGLGRALDEERARERRLRHAGVIVVRWEARDALDPARARRLAAQLRRELAAARRAHSFSGTVVQL